jgi:hypothetical protein
MNQAAADRKISPPSWAARMIGIDPRSLAAFRICLAAILLVDLATRATDLPAFYADDGMLSIAMARSYHVNDWHWSLLYLNGSIAYQAAMFGVAAVLAAILLVGWHTRLATIGCWIFAVSLYNRNPMVCNYGDLVVRLFLFWGMFLPLGQVWSLDSRRRGAAMCAARQPLIAVASACVLIQLCLLYFFAGIYKLNGDWFAGDAAHFALLLDYCGRPLGLRLLEFPQLLKLLTQATLILELLGPIAVWIPWRTARIRLLMIAAFLALHVGIELCLTPGVLSYACMTAWLLFLPTSFWDHGIAAYFFSRPRDVEQADSMAPTSRRVVAGRLINAALCLFFLWYVIGWNIASLDWQRLGGFMPERLRWIGYWTQTRQIWDMFYIPSRENDWYAARGTLADGGIVDVLTGGAIEEAQPRRWWSGLPNYRWRFFFRRLSFQENRDFRPVVVRFLFDDWNRRHPHPDRQVRQVELLHFVQSRGDEFGAADFVCTSFGAYPDSLADVHGVARTLDLLQHGQSPLP